jgi:hypothetical protein
MLETNFFLYLCCILINTYLKVDLTKFSNNSQQFISMLEQEGFTKARVDWFTCGQNSCLKYEYKNHTSKSWVNFSTKGGEVEVSSYNLK